MLGYPLHHIVEVILLFLAEELELPLDRFAAPSDVVMHIGVAARHEPFDVIGFPEVEDRPLRQMLQVLLVGGGGIDGGELTRGIRPEDVNSEIERIWKNKPAKQKVEDRDLLFQALEKIL